MSTSIKFTNGDLDTTGTKINLVSGSDQVVQEVGNSLRFVQGEWPLNKQLGFPYYNAVFTRATTIAALRALYARRIRQFKGITGLADCRINTDDLGAGNLIVEWEATTVVGGLQVKETIPVQQLGVRV